MSHEAKLFPNVLFNIVNMYQRANNRNSIVILRFDIFAFKIQSIFENLGKIMNTIRRN